MPLKPTRSRAALAIVTATIFTTLIPMHAAQPDPKVLSYKLPDQIKWMDSPSGAKQAVLFGNPSKPGLYIIMVKWPPHMMSHP
ncbi:MAG: hypothetical protein JOZ32_12080, partial [Bryobacterales bacterium]|nr:hypothetical protein [Bryobacterales bacterium]